MSCLAKSDLVPINILYSNFLNSSRVELLLFLKQLAFQLTQVVIKENFCSFEFINFDISLILVSKIGVK